jgi:hypothetical protein
MLVTILGIVQSRPLKKEKPINQGLPKILLPGRKSALRNLSEKAPPFKNAGRFYVEDLCLNPTDVLKSVLPARAPR